MNRIRLLPEHVANQIAAGEVIERPASVVKELVENALDAQAARITVDVQAGGRSLMRVTDDGLGMSRDDALLCFEPHATSKIQRAEDLAAIATMGFRGEALPSIASVSRLTLTTRERESANADATQVNIAGGRIHEVKAASGPPGTCVEVRHLFFNLPARRKFLRREETERAHIQHYLALAAMAFPEVGFTLAHDQRIIWQLPPVAAGPDQAGRLTALRERLRGLYGAELNLLPVNFRAVLQMGDSVEADAAADAAGGDDREPASLSVWGFIGAPGLSRATREDQHLFVNRRPVEDRGLNFALLEGYHTALMKGRYPVCCLFLELDPAWVDVNIHPAKREVKFRAERQVRAQVTHAVRRTLLAYHAGPRSVPQPAAPAPRPAAATGPPPTAMPAAAPSGLPSSPIAAPPVRQPLIPWPTPEPAAIARAPDQAAALPPNATAGQPGRGSQLSGPAGRPEALPATAGAATPLLEVPLRLVGVIGRLYVLFESDRGLVLMDQHAAHERVLFEQMLQRLESDQGAAPCQRLLLPATVELSVRDAQFLREALPTLARLGVSLSEFGPRTFLLDGLPPLIKTPDARRFVLEVLDELKAAGQEVNSLRLGEQVIATTVCRHAVKANDPLGPAELERLLAELRRCAMPYTCPHGRPTLIEVNFRELEKKFGRTQP